MSVLCNDNHQTFCAKVGERGVTNEGWEDIGISREMVLISVKLPGITGRVRGRRTSGKHALQLDLQTFASVWHLANEKLKESSISKLCIFLILKE